MIEKRGSRYLKQFDRYIGSVILLMLSLALRVKRRFQPVGIDSSGPMLLICFGAIGDLIVLTTAARQILAERKVYLACSKLNFPCTKLYEDFYAGVAIADIRNPLSILNICKQFKVTQIIDSTQWANIGPIQAGIATLLSSGINSIGFKTNRAVRNTTYDLVIDHSRDIHEAANFMNLLSGKTVISSNAQLPTFLPALYQKKSCLKTGKVLLHMWPSGNRAHLKAWPAMHWQKLALHLVNEGYTIYLSGSPADQDHTKAFIEKTGLPLVNLAGTMDLKSLLHFLKEEIEFAVSVNTGILHLLVEAGVPAVALHGGVNPERWGPLGINTISLLPPSGPRAYLHYGFEYPERDEDAYALDKLTVEQVYEAITTLSKEGNISS
ncbi:glycosyltransferase family 9 protein [Polynucleobacter asymbioticus]|uniref:glycosyltransferase family 9 protein n=1 Tax=Polynucleobacter asymbioticus TaxID=576611 RepID=UPI0008F8569B|nr:glycosyltransferase family 9 protein [Polynucleobacter asymbioticus]